jgi:FkbM family methyltransferase
MLPSRHGRSGALSLYNPGGLHELAVAMLHHYRAGDTTAAAAALDRMQVTMRALIADERASGGAAAAQGLPHKTIAHETSIAMMLRSFPYLPEHADALRRCYEELARAFHALGQPLAAGWARELARGAPMRFATDGSCQIAVLPAIFERYLPAPLGAFVEVGAYDGVTFSNSSGLADAGWHGLYIEPQPGNLSLCRGRHQANPNLRFENCAIGRAAGQGFVVDAGAFSIVSTAPGTPPTGDAVPIEIVRLETLLAKHAVPREFDLLIVDVEGGEEAVFDSFDLDVWRPRLLIAELGDIDGDAREPVEPRARTHRQIVGHGYSVVYRDRINVVYLRDV